MPAQSFRPKLFYDGGCPICSREVALYRSGPGAERLDWVDLSQCGTADLGPGLSREAALGRLHLRLADGRLLSGAAAFTALWTLLPRWAWLGRSLSPAPMQWLLEAAYRLFLRLRRLWRRPLRP